MQSSATSFLWEQDNSIANDCFSATWVQYPTMCRPSFSICFFFLLFGFCTQSTSQHQKVMHINVINYTFGPFSGQVRCTTKELPSKEISEFMEAIFIGCPFPKQPTVWLEKLQLSWGDPLEPYAWSHQALQQGWTLERIALTPSCATRAKSIRLTL